MPTLVELVNERFPSLTEVQQQAMPRVMDGKHVLILAPTGSGKTEASLLPVLEKIDKTKGGIQALYITPLRALGRDMLLRFNWWCDRLGISHDIRHGDSTISERTKHRKKPPQILIITVETLQALLLGRVMRQHLRNVRHVIIDEIHDILDNKRGAQLSLGLERLEWVAPGFQRVALSATVAQPHEAAKLAFGSRTHEIVEVGRGRKMDIQIERHGMEKRMERLKELVEEEKTLLFVNTRSTAEEVGAALRKKDVALEMHHGSLSKEVRITAEERFKKGEVNVLLATSSMELGLDIGDVERIVQYGSPHQVFRMVQRVGRSGHRLDAVPRGFVLTVDWDDHYEAEALRMFAAQQWLENKAVEKGALDVIAHQLVGLCLDRGMVGLEDAHRIFQQAGAYGLGFHTLKRVALQLYGEGLIFYSEKTEQEIWIKAKRNAREYYYSYLSTIPKEKRYAMRDVVSNRILASLDERFVVNLQIGQSFLAKGKAWSVMEIEQEVLVEPSGATEILVPEWVGEDIPVAREIAQQVARLRTAHKEAPPVDAVVLEMVDELVVIHTCAGTRINECIGRVVAHRLSERLGEPCQMVSDPYRIMLRLPYVLEEKHIREQWEKIGDMQSELEQSLVGSALLRFKFIHVARLFGLLDVDATVGQRFIDAMKNSVVYQETVRSIFSRYFDVNGAARLMEEVRNGTKALHMEKREKPGLFARIGLDRLGGKEAIGAFEPRKHMIAAFREKALGKILELECTSCGATRMVWLANAPDTVACPKCKKNRLGIRKENRKDIEYSANLIANYGKRALIALATHGVGAATAERILRRLHPDEENFYWDLIEAQKNFIKNKKYWKLG